MPTRAAGAPLDALYRAVFEHGVDPAVLTKPDGTILRANAAACRAFGLSEAELRRQGRVGRLVDDDGLRRFLAERERTGTATGELTVRRGDGTVFSADVSSSVILEEGGERFTYIVFKDLTARRRAEDALRESEERFRLLANAMPQIVCVLRPDGAPEYVNPSWTAFSGLDLAATARAGWDRIVHPDDAPAVRDCRVRVLKRLTPQDVELRYRAADGSYRWFLSRLAPVVEGGRVVRFVGAAMDIEERRRAEEALRESERRYRTMGETLPYGVWLCNAEGGTEYVSQSFLDLLEMTHEEMRQFGWTKRLPPGDVQPMLEKWLQCVRTGTPWDSEHRVLGPDGRYHHVLTRGLPVRDENGKITSWVGINLDIDDRKRMEDALRDADRRKDEFLGMLSHELRNPLAPIRNALYILERAEPASEQAFRAKEIAKRQVAHLNRLVDDLLDVTRIARGKIELRRADLDLATLAWRTTEDHRALMHDRAIELRAELPRDPVAVSGDETRLAQVIGNLLHNAAKFTPAGGCVTVALRVEDGRAVLRVRDTGAGIAPGLLRSIFDPFTQAEQTLARSEGGLGLGLALVKGIIDLHGGEVVALSQGEGRGSEFVVALPLVSPRAETPAHEARAAEHAAAGWCVLVVDDNRDAAETLAQLVEMLGHEATVAFDGPSAIALARERRPDVVLCDIGLPRMDGFQVARELRSAYGPALRLVAVTGYAQADDVARAQAAGFDVHLAKPMDPATLHGVLGTRDRPAAP